MTTSASLTTATGAGVLSITLFTTSTFTSSTFSSFCIGTLTSQTFPIENDILFPSFKAEEKGFIKNQKFLDIVGRKYPAKKMLQTFCPSHHFLQKIQENNFQKFYQSEISARKSLHYPPFSTSIEISKNAKTQASLEKNFLAIQSEISEFCERTFPIQISYHPQRQLFTAKMLIFSKDAQKIWKLLQKKGVTFNRYSE